MGDTIHKSRPPRSLTSAGSIFKINLNKFDVASNTNCFLIRTIKPLTSQDHRLGKAGPNMNISTQLSPESITAVEILESIDSNQRSRALEMLRNFVHELRSEQKWEELFAKHPSPMIKMARQALKEHEEGRSRKL